MNIDQTDYYREKNGYITSEIEAKAIPDDDSILETIYSELKSSYKTNVTRDVDFRIA